MPITNKEVKVGDRFAVLYDGKKYIAEAKAGAEDGDPVIRVVSPKDFKGLTHENVEKRMTGGKDGKTFSSLNALMVTLQYPRNFGSQWTFWTREGEFDAKTAKDLSVKPVREVKPKAEKAAKAPKAAKAEKAPKKARTPKVYDVIRKTDDGRFWCDGCMAPFDYEGEGVPTECPEGHTTANLHVNDDEVSEPVGESVEEAVS